MKKILVPTDFSDNALKAAMYAAEIAQRMRASLYLLHAAEMGHDKFYQPVSLYERYNNLVLEECTERLEKLKIVLQDNYKDLQVEILVDPEISVAESIKNHCREHNIDLVVMGTKGATGLKSILIGSVAASAVSQAVVPVLTIPSTYIPEQPDAILLATSHFEEDDAVVGMMTDLVKAFPSVFHVVVFLNREKSDASDYITNMEKLERYVKNIKKKYPALTIQSTILEGESLEDAIELYSLQNDVDIIGLVSYPKTFFEKLFLKSTTRNMTFHSRVPVLAIPAVKLQES